MSRVALALVALCACAPQKSQPPATTQLEKPPAQVFLNAKDGATIQVTVEIADTPASRNQGLMYRQSLADNAGMLFLFANETVHAFWMKNTLIPLDMIFIRADMSVAGVVENAEPMTETSRSVNAPTQYVLEVNGGFAAKYGVGAGTRVRFENVPSAPPY